MSRIKEGDFKGLHEVYQDFTNQFEIDRLDKKDDIRDSIPTALR